MNIGSEESKRVLKLAFGALADPIGKQLKDQGFEITEEQCAYFDDLAFKTVYLSIHGVLSRKEEEIVINRIHKLVAQAVKNRLQTESANAMSTDKKEKTNGFRRS